MEIINLIYEYPITTFFLGCGFFWGVSEVIYAIKDNNYYGE